MSRYGTRSEFDVDARYEDRRSTIGPRGTRLESRYDDVDVDFRRGSGPLPARERQSVLVKERDEYERRGTTPAFLRDDYGANSTAGAMVLRERDREDITYAPRRRRSPSPEKREREEIVIRRDERESRAEPVRPRPREQSREREEIIIRRDERSESRPPPPRRREQSREREEIIIRRDSRSESRPPPSRIRERSRDREEIIIRRDERDERESIAPPRRSTTAPIRESERDREEIIIRRDDRDTRSRFEDDIVSQRSYRPPPPPARDNVDRSEIIIRREQIEADEPPPPPRMSSRRSRYEEEVVSNRPISRERARSRARSHESVSDEEIIIRRDERDTRGGGEESRQEIIIRRSSRSRSPSPTASVSTRAAPAPAPEPQIIYAPQIHQEVITHHRHVDHGYEVRNARRENMYSRPPSPPSPPPPPPPAPVSVRGRSRSLSEERIEIKRSETRNGRRETEDIVISRNERSESRGPPPSRAAESRMVVREEEREEIDISSRRGRSDWEERNIAEEAEYYNDRALSRGYPGEAYHGATRDWGLVDIPPGTRRVRMDGAGGGAQEVTWKRYDGNRRSKFYPDGDMDEGYTTDPGRPSHRHRPIREPSPEAPAPTIAARYGNRRDPRDGLWTEVTKDLVVKEAIQEMGWEYQETDEHYYIFRYMEYVSRRSR